MSFAQVPDKAAPCLGLSVKYCYHTSFHPKTILKGATHHHALLHVAENFDFQGK